MKYLVGFVVVCFIANALGPWFWILLFGLVGISLGWWILDNLSLSPEERAQRNREKREREQAAYLAGVEEARLKRQLEIQAEHERKQRKASLLGGIGGTAAKVGVSLAIKALTGANHTHRHQ